MTARFLVLALAASLSAQGTAIFPPYAGSADGQTYNAYTPLSNGVNRSQYIYDRSELTIPNLASIKSLGFRQDCQTRTASPSFKLQLEIKMSPTMRTAADVSYLFANNYPTATTPTTVFVKQIWDMPSFPAPTATLPNPSANTVSIPITPYVYDNTKNLLVEYVVYANLNGNQTFPYYVDTMTHKSTTTPYGTGCMTSNNTVSALTATAPALGTSWTVSMTKSTPTAPSALMIGDQNTSWNGNPLPLSLAAFGAPLCNLHVNIVFSLGAIVSSNGAANYYVATPNNVLFNNVSLFAQVAVYDPFANNFGIVTSNGVQTTFGVPAQCCGVTSYNNANATSGSVFYSQGDVSLFGY